MESKIVKTATALKESLRGVTDVDGNLSYSNGVKNILGIKQTNEKIRLRVGNPSGVDRFLLVSASSVGFLGADAADENEEIAALVGIDAGVMHSFFVPSYDDGGAPATVLFTIDPLDPRQKLAAIAAQMAYSPIFFRAARMKSYTTAGAPESSNFGNEIAHYSMDYFKGEILKDTPLILSEFEKRSDTTTSVMSVDFVDRKFPAFAGSKDFLVFQVNAGTKMDIELVVGARTDVSENFYKTVKNGIEVLHSRFPKSVNKSCDS